MVATQIGFVVDAFKMPLTPEFDSVKARQLPGMHELKSIPYRTDRPSCYLNKIPIMEYLAVAFSPPAFFFFFWGGGAKWKLARAHKFHSVGQDQSTMAQRAETTVAECSLTSCV